MTTKEFAGPPRRRVGDADGAPGRRVLLAFADPVSAGRLAKRFSESRVLPTLAFSCGDLVQQARDGRYALVVLDESFACEHGSACLDEVRTVASAPIVALTQLDDQTHEGIALALDSANSGEIAAKGVALIEMNRPVALPHPIRWGGLELDLRTHQARWRGQPIHLTAPQFRIMEVLVLAAGAVVTTEQLARRVWGESSFDDADRLVAHIRRIRKLIERDSAMPEFLLRVRGTGFRLTDRD